ncbi:little elongation complex subunit 1-like isoform X2 [Silurus meridionalis]|uniref:little elongation complex subunit 1-like isoform X2 n=1 Tax=Silurus meridionalis TaxID=175797 RepID=UPI001EEA20CE|nr:little elongation complex subunit 1-like isoform X2 [Silurus meridionalis]
MLVLKTRHLKVGRVLMLLPSVYENTSQHLVMRGLKNKFESLEKSIGSTEEKLSKIKNELNKDVKSPLPGNQTQTNLRAKRAASDMPPPSAAKTPRFDAAPHKHTTQSLITSALETLQDSCYDVLSPNWIDALLKGKCELPSLTDEEKSVISKFCVNESLAETFLKVVLDKIKAEKESMGHELLQSLCRVYVGLCQKRGDLYKAHALAYRFLKEDFSEAPKLIIVMVTAWPSVFSQNSPLCRAIHIVCKMKAYGKIYYVLSKYLHWHTEPPGNIYRAITSTLKALLEDKSLTFQKSSWYGDDLCPAAWDYVFSLDLLSAQLGWIWTVTHVIRKGVLLILKTRLLQTQTEETFKNVSVAAIFRLLGRLGQQGLKENLAASVEDLGKSITEFGRQNDLPWEVQLAVVYATHDLAPSNPKVALKALESWKQNLTKPVPPAVTKCLKQIGFLCSNIKLKN